MSKIAEKIQKLLAKAGSTSSEHEAEALAAKAQELLLQHGLTMADLPSGEQEEIGERQERLTYFDKWRSQLYTACGRLYMCQVILSPRTKTYSIVGRSGAAETAVQMIRHLERTVVRMAREHSPVRREQLQFERGCGASIASRIFILARRSREQETGGVSGQAVALYRTEMEAAEDRAAEIYPNLRAIRSRKSRVTPSYMEGVLAGGRVSLSLGEIS